MKSAMLLKLPLPHSRMCRRSSAKRFSLNDDFTADSSFTWLPFVFKFGGLVSLSFRAEWRGRGTFSGCIQSLVKAVQACGTWEACLSGGELSFGTPQFLTEQKMIFLNVSNYICGGVSGEVHKCDCKKNSFRNKHLFSAHTSMMMVFHASRWMPPEERCRKVCFESWTIGCPGLIPPWEKAEPEASLGCGVWTRLLRSPSLSPANVCIQVTDGSKVNLWQEKVLQKDVTCQGGGTVG